MVGKESNTSAKISLAFPYAAIRNASLTLIEAADGCVTAFL